MTNSNAAMLSRAQGCWLGQLTGDALGSMVEFKTVETIRSLYPHGLRTLAGSSVFNTIAGQPTDDSEMALMLARMIVDRGEYNAAVAFENYKFWLASDPFDAGETIKGALRGHLDYNSQANGAMMRISPLAIFGANHELSQVAEWARQDAELTHPNPVCIQANALFAMAVSFAIKTGASAQQVYDQLVAQATEMNVEPMLMNVIRAAATEPPANYVEKMGWVLIAFQNTLFQLLHAANFEEAIVDTVMRGGDTDTNAAICGALLGAVYGRDVVPQQWVDCVLNCRPEKDAQGVHQPRPEVFWPGDAMELAEQLLSK